MDTLLETLVATFVLTTGRGAGLLLLISVCSAVASVVEPSGLAVTSLCFDWLTDSSQRPACAVIPTAVRTAVNSASVDDVALLFILILSSVTWSSTRLACRSSPVKHN